MGGYDQSPTEFAEEVQTFAQQKLVNFLGGCCGTTPDYIQKLKLAVQAAPHRGDVKNDPFMCVSGLEMLRVTPDLNFINIGERCNIAGSRRFRRLISENKFSDALEVARKQVENGAQFIDINVDDVCSKSLHK